MKKLQTASIIILFITIFVFILRLFINPFPDWLLRVNGILMLVTIFTASFSTVRISMSKK